MQVRHDEGVAIRIDPEPCAVVRKDDSEASVADDARTLEVRLCRSVRWAALESGGLKSLQRSDEGRCIQRQG